MKTARCDQPCYKMSKDNQPILRVEPGEEFCVETQDCYSNNLRTLQDRFTKEMWATVNPATGPVYVEGAVPGDILRVEILRIETRNHAVMCVEQGAGALGEKIQGSETTIHEIRDGHLVVNERLSLPICPMIGVIGTAPAGDAIPTGTPGEHGGNMDTKEIVAGSCVFLPVFVNGALLAMGDIHALMGDGEVCICGAETSGKIFLRVFVLKSRMPTPCVENANHLFFIGSAVALDECEKIVLDKAHRFLTTCLNLPPNEAARVMSLTGDLRVSQVVDPLKTMKFALPKNVLAQLGMERMT